MSKHHPGEYHLSPSDYASPFPKRTADSADLIMCRRQTGIGEFQRPLSRPHVFKYLRLCILQPSDVFVRNVMGNGKSSILYKAYITLSARTQTG